MCVLTNSDRTTCQNLNPDLGCLILSTLHLLMKLPVAPIKIGLTLWQQLCLLIQEFLHKQTKNFALAVHHVKDTLKYSKKEFF